MNGILLPVVVGYIRTLKDGSISISIETQELPASKVGEIFGLRNKICYVYFSERQIEDNEKKVIDSLDPELKGKTPGQRLRGVLYRKWEQDNEGYKDSETYYKAKMETIISHYKTELS